MTKTKTLNASNVNSLTFGTINPYVNYFLMFKMTKGLLEKIYINRDVRESNICARQTSNYVLTAEDDIASVFKDEVSCVRYEVEDVLSTALKEIEKKYQKR